jgi:hypothetical protein
MGIHHIGKTSYQNLNLSLGNSYAFSYLSYFSAGKLNE